MEQRIKVGDWLVDPHSNHLQRGAKTTHVEPKAMDVLMLLAAHVGRVVSREEIFAAVWPGVVVGDEALTQSVIKLRRALGDDSRAPVYIETIAKRGYRLIAPIVPLDDVPAPPPASAPATSRGSWRAIGIVAAVLVAAGMAIGYAQLAPLDVASPSEALQATRESDWLTVRVEAFESEPGSEQENLARGISEDLAIDLSRVPDLRLIRGTPGTPSAARYDVSGTVRREGNTLRINVFLVDTGTGQQLWGGRFERPYGDLFAVQDEITRSIVELLPAKMSEAERRRVARRYTRSLAAYDAFQRGQALFLARTSADNEAARAQYRKAIELDPHFARAYASLAMTYAMEHRLGASADASPALSRAFELAETARLMDPDIPQVYWALGFVHAQSRRHALAAEELQRAIALDPSFADAYALLAGIRTYTGQPAESIALLRTAMRLNPDGGYLYYLLLGRAYLFLGDFEQATVNLREAALRNPVDVETRVFLAAALAARGDIGAARWEVDEIGALQPGFSPREWLGTYPMTAVAQRERLLSLLEAAQP